MTEDELQKENRLLKIKLAIFENLDLAKCNHKDQDNPSCRDCSHSKIHTKSEICDTNCFFTGEEIKVKCIKL